MRSSQRFPTKKKLPHIARLFLRKKNSLHDHMFLETTGTKTAPSNAISQTCVFRAKFRNSTTPKYTASCPMSRGLKQQKKSQEFAWQSNSFAFVTRRHRSLTRRLDRQFCYCHMNGKLIAAKSPHPLRGSRFFSFII